MENRNLDHLLGAGMTRRSFAFLSLAAGLAAATTARAAQGMQVNESIVQIKTKDGMCDASFAHPATGSYPGVIVWTDILGLRPQFRDLAKRLAAEGYAVLVPNPFYRKGKAPVFDGPLNLPADFPKVMPIVATINAPGAVESDSTAFVAFLDSQPSVSKAKKIGVHGYCMGGSLAMRTAATLGDRAGAGATFHASRLVTDQPNSPHLLVPKIKSRFYFGVAESDDKEEVGAKEKLKAAFDAVKVPAEVELYPGTEHGWCIPGTPNYNMAAAERAWAKLVSFYKQGIA